MTERPRSAPYDLVFGVESIDDKLFPPIVEEAGARGVPLDDPDRFLFLTSVGRLLQAVAGESETTAGESMKQHGRLLFHAVHFWREGKHVAQLAEDRLRTLLEGGVDVGDWALATPAPAGYHCLPRNRVWASPGPGLTPEPADGFFWVDRPDGLAVLLVLGVRPDRPGFSVVSAQGEAVGEGGGAGGHWARVVARPGGQDFASTIPGGELDGLHSVETPLELLKLASLCFWQLDRGE
jgi:hypothetical protein